MAKELISGAHILMRSLIHEGVTTLFGYPGGAIMPTYDALFDYTDSLQHILVRHEQAAAHAAEGYARVSGKVGVCLVTSGPGATNTITGIADALMDSTPIVVIAGQVAAHLLGSDAFQECDVVNVAQPITKWSYQIRSASEVAWAVSRAFYIARSGRPGPVVLDFTRSAQLELAEYLPQTINHIRSYVPVPPMCEEAIASAATLINNAQRPLVLVGQGVELGEAQEELRAFIELADIPAGCTLLGLSALPSAHPLNMGMLGMHGTLANNIKTQECDLLIAVGMRFDDRITGKLDTYAKQAKKIHFDIDPVEINKNVKVDVAVLGDCKVTLPAVTRLLKKKDHRVWRASFEPYHERERIRVVEPELFPTTGPIKMGEAIHRISEATGHKAVCVTDVGQNQMMAARYFKFSQKRSLLTSGGMGTMGYGLPAAIGATFGAPERDVILMVGDGGIQMVIEEFGTILEYGCPVKMVLLNNEYLGNVRQWQEMFFNHRYSFSPMRNPNFQLIAAGYGIKSRRVTEREHLDEAIAEMMSTDGAYLLEVCVEQEGTVMPMCCPGSAINDMILEIKHT